MLRFAPSPTGEMHIGNLRVAIFNYIVSKQRKEDLIVRIEDIDREKNIEGIDQEIVGILELFGIEYSQVIHQSQNFKFHSAMALQLLHEKRAFSCFCSPEWLQKKREEAKEANVEYKYDDACRNLPAELVIDNTAPFTVRIARPDKAIVIQDHIKGEMSFDRDSVDSFVILNQDKTPTYDFATAVDDMLSDISLVIRDEKYLENTPKQIHVRNQLGYEKKVEYAHFPSLLGEDVSVKQLLEEGYLPDAIANYLIVLAHKTPSEIFTIKEALEWFDLDSISDSPAHFEIEKLKEINREHLMRMDAKELSRYVGFADAEIGELARLYLNNEVVTTKALKSKIAPIFEERNIPSSFIEEVEKAAKAIKSAPYFDKYDDFKAYLLKESALQEKTLVKALHILLTNAEDGPDIAEVYKYLKNYIGEIVK